MNAPINPYAAPTTDLSPAAQEWLVQMPAALRQVARGLNLVYLALIFAFLLLIVAVSMPMIVGLRETLEYLPLIEWGALAATLLNLVGMMYCLATPRETGSSYWIAASVLFALPNVAFVLSQRAGVELPQTFTWISGISYVLAGVLFVLFLRALAIFIGQRPLVTMARDVLILYFLVGVIIVFMILLANDVIKTRMDAEISLGSAITLLVLAVAILIKYGRLLVRLRAAILDGLQASPST